MAAKISKLQEIPKRASCSKCQ